MKWIKKSALFVKENNDAISNDALEILASNDEGQKPEVQTALDSLNDATTSGKVVTRFAPSPTGFLHIGGIRTALYNYLFAKKHGGTFYLRIEDTDQKRYVAEAEKYIQDALHWCGIEPDHSPWGGGPNGPYRQSERDYSKHREFLLNKGLAYYAFDTEKDLTEARSKDPNFAYDSRTRMSMKNSLSLPESEVKELLDKGAPYVIRFKTTPNKTVTFTDIVRGEVSFNSNQTDDKVLIKSNGIPTYHMANVCDDHDMGTTHVIRGEEWLPSTPLHLMLYEAFEWTPPVFAHLPLLLNPDGKGKLSKRTALRLGFPVFPMGGEGEDEKGNMVKYKGFKDEGYEPEAVINFLVMLGWTPSGDKEILDVADMISEFDLHKVHKAGAKFDIEKAKWFNANYLHKKDDSDLEGDVDKGSDYSYDPQKTAMIMDLAKKRSHFRGDLQAVADIFYKPVVISQSEKDKCTDEFKKVFSNSDSKLSAINWDIENIKTLIFELCKDNGVKMNKVMPSLRLAITGGIPGPDLPMTMYILGKEESVKRIEELL